MYLSLGHRIKTAESLSGKLQRKYGKYQQLSDLTDILGVRIICYFSTDVNLISELVKNAFRIDYANSVDKRELLDPTEFGYLSVHFICQLTDIPEDAPELSDLKFEIQIRSTLQHVWAEIEHDLGYKSTVTVPKQIIRDFSRVAGLLEIADEKFVTIRDTLRGYSDEIRGKISTGDLADIPLDLISLTEYMQRNESLLAFRSRLESITGLVITELSPDEYIPQLNWLGIKTLGDMDRMLADNRDLAEQFAETTLSDSDMTLLSSTLVLRFLCQAELLRGQYTEEQITEFFLLTAISEKRAKKQAKYLLKCQDKQEKGCKKLSKELDGKPKDKDEHEEDDN